MAGKVEHAIVALGIRCEPGVRRGRIWGHCPLHLKRVGAEDAQPSWFIRVERQRYGQHHCFSCKAGGTLVELVMEMRGLDADGARAWLASVEGAEPEPEEMPEAVTVEIATSARRAFELPREVILEPLVRWVTPARRYAEARGICASQVERWGIGYAVDGPLEGRIVIPVRGRDGAPRTYMARTFAGHDRRYLYPSGRDYPDLDAVFGEQHWQLDRDEVVVCEGALNALAVERALPGANVAALGGSRVRPMHVAKLALFRAVVILTDSDAAGDSAAEEIAGTLRRHVRTIARVRLPDGKDANDIDPVKLCEEICAVYPVPTRRS